VQPLAAVSDVGVAQVAHVPSVHWSGSWQVIATPPSEWVTGTDSGENHLIGRHRIEPAATAPDLGVASIHNKLVLVRPNRDANAAT
jgi:hypothetical protein